MKTTTPDTHRAGFLFAKDLADLEFRQFLKENGWVSGDRVVACFTTTPIHQIIDVVPADGSVWIAVHNPDEARWTLRYMMSIRLLTDGA